jgi:hypothetical protein
MHLSYGEYNYVAVTIHKKIEKTTYVKQNEYRGMYLRTQLHIQVMFLCCLLQLQCMRFTWKGFNVTI